MSSETINKYIIKKIKIKTDFTHTLKRFIKISSEYTIFEFNIKKFHPEKFASYFYPMELSESLQTQKNLTKVVKLQKYTIEP